MSRLVRSAIIVLAMVVWYPRAVSASIITITAADVGEGFAVLGTGTGSGTGTPVSALLQAIVSSYTQDAIAMTTTLVLDITLTNTTATDSSLRGYGFSANPNVQPGSTATNSEFGFDTVTTGLTSNPSVGNVENCVADQVENQCTGLSGGLESGQVDTHTLTLLFSGVLNSLQLGDANTGMYFRLQSIGAQDDSAKIFGNPPLFPTPFSNPPTPAPEPASLLMLGTGLVFVARLAHKKFAARS